jgi:hypothetical protein
VDTFVFSPNLGQDTGGQNEKQLSHFEMPALLSGNVHNIAENVVHDAIDVSAALDHMLASHLHAAQNVHF